METIPPEATKYLAIDFGEKRVGVAISDTKKIVAKPLTTILRKSDLQVIEEIQAIVEGHDISKIIVGVPFSYSAEGVSEGSQEERNINFFKKLKSYFINIDIVTWDETFSTKSVKNKKKNVDAKAAAIILQEFLDSQKK